MKQISFAPLSVSVVVTQTDREVINAHLADKGLFMREGTIVDATIASAPPKQPII